MRSLTVWVFLTAVLLGGCGGGGGGTSSPAGQSFQILWPARTRSAPLTSPGSALSAQVVFANGAGAGNVTVNVNRDTSKLVAYTGTYPLPSQLKSATTTVTATFYAMAGEAGSVVATATGSASVGGSSLDLANIVLSSKVAKVTVSPISLALGATPAQLGFAAYDSSNNLIALTPGSATWAIISGSADLGLTPAGIATPIQAGSATVTATVDGVASLAATITVTSSTTSGISFSDLLPGGDNFGEILCMSPSGQVAGWVVHTVGAQDASRACIWNGLTPSVTELDTFSSGVNANSGSRQAGFGATAGAVDWSGSLSSEVTLNNTATAVAINGTTVGGSIGVAGFHSDACIWTNGVANGLIDLNPAGAHASAILGGSNGVWVGDLQPTSGGIHAAIWNGTSNSATDIAPSGVFNSYAIAADGGTQVGATGTLNGGDNTAALWHGSSASYVNISPAGSTLSFATGISGGYIVGLYTMNSDASNAVIWNASTRKFINLNSVLGSTYTQSGATCILVTSTGATVGGWASVGSGGLHPIVWHVPSSSLP